MARISGKVFGVLLSVGLALLVTLALLFDYSRSVLIVDGKTHTEYSFNKGTVGELLDHFSVKLSSQDIVRPPLSEQVRWRTRVQVVRVSERLEKSEEVVDFVLEWKRRTSRNLRKVEIQHGYREKTVWDVKKVLHDGKEVSAIKSVEKVIRTPVDRLVFLNKGGYATKIYDLSKAKKVQLVATAYWLGDPQVPGDTTFSGHKVQRGLVAVDPTVFPLGWRLFIPGYGYAYSSDTGSAIKGKRIDLFVSNKKDSLNYEWIKVDVYMLEKAPRW